MKQMKNKTLLLGMCGILLTFGLLVTSGDDGGHHRHNKTINHRRGLNNGLYRRR